MKDKINPKLEEGDRIVLIMMPGETSVSYGDRGTINKVNHARSFIQYFVDWDNGSRLALIEDLGDESNTIDKWIKEDDFDNLMYSKKRKNLGESDQKNKMEHLISNVEVFRTFDRVFLFSFLEKLRESGITNMFGAAPYLYMGSDIIAIVHKYDENKDDDAFDELVEMADEAKDKMIQGAVKILQKEGKEITVESVSRVIKRYSSKVLDMWMTTYH
jgi:hypothetical protein